MWKICLDKNNNKIKTSKENIFNILNFLLLIFFRSINYQTSFSKKKKMKKRKSFMEGIGKNFVIKGFYRNFLTLKGKFHHQSQIIPKFGKCI